MKFIHLTDPHLVARPQKLFDLDLHERLDAAVASINQNQSDAEFCMVTGDLTHWAEPQAYAEVIESLDRLAMPWHPLLGNHDSREVARDALPEATWSDGGFLQYVVETPMGPFIVLDTLRDGRPTGWLCEARLGWLRSQLETARDAGRQVYLFMHHAPMVVGIDEMDKIRLRNSDDFVAVIEGFDNIRHLFFGHLHRACHGSWRGIPFSTVRAVAHQIALNLEPEAPLFGSGENPAYAVVLVSDEAVVIHDHSYLEEDNIFPYDRGFPETPGDNRPPLSGKPGDDPD